MSMFREDVDDFVTWTNTEVDRSVRPPEWHGFTFTETGPAYPWSNLTEKWWIWK